MTALIGLNQIYIRYIVFLHSKHVLLLTLTQVNEIRVPNYNTHKKTNVLIIVQKVSVFCYGFAISFQATVGIAKCFPIINKAIRTSTRFIKTS